MMDKWQGSFLAFFCPTGTGRIRLLSCGDRKWVTVQGGKKSDSMSVYIMIMVYKIIGLARCKMTLSAK